MKKKKLEFRQLDLTDCGAACLASVCSFYNLRESVARIRQIAGTNEKGTNLLGLKEAAEKLGFNTKAVRINKADIDKLPFPCICHLVIRKKWFHFVVLYRAGKDRITIMDPAAGKLITRKKELFLEDFSGVCLLLEKGDGFTEGTNIVSNTSRFLELMKPFRLHLAKALMAAAVYSALGISISIFIKQLVDVIIPAGNIRVLNLFSCIFLVILIIRTLTGYMKNSLLLKTGLKIDGRLIFGYYRHIMRLPIGFFNTMQTGEIISRINDAVKIRNFINSTSLDLVVNISILFFSLTFMLFISPGMSLIVLISLPVFYLIYMLFNRFNRIFIRRVMESSAELESSLVETFTAIETIKTSSSEGYFTERLDRSGMRVLDTGYRVNRIYLKSGSIIEGISAVQTILILWTGSLLVFRGEMTTGDMISFYTLFGYLSPPLFKLILANKNIQDAMIAADRLFQVMDLETEVSPEGFYPGENNTLKSIEFEKISFKYPGQTGLIDNVSLRCSPYTITTILGESGSGKSTLLSLIINLVTPDRGTRRLNLTDYEHLDHNYIRKNTGFIPQKPVMVSGTIMENIAFGDHNPDITKIERLISEVGLKDLIERLPDRLRSSVSDGGNNFSGGEKQKMVIARALYRNPPVILFDEPTSSMDPGSVEKFFELLGKLKKKGKTIVIVSHDRRFCKISDQVLLLGDGTLTANNSLTHFKTDLQNSKDYQSWKIIGIEQFNHR